jgi:hypothetical protein
MRGPSSRRYHSSGHLKSSARELLRSALACSAKGPDSCIGPGAEALYGRRVNAGAVVVFYLGWVGSIFGWVHFLTQGMVEHYVDPPRIMTKSMKRFETKDSAARFSKTTSYDDELASAAMPLGSCLL